MSQSSVAYGEGDYEEDEDDGGEMSISAERILTRNLDEAIGSINQRIVTGRLILQPEFQRQYVWPPNKASALIESILLGIPLPTFYMAELPSGKWEAVDGQQRLTSVNAFMQGRFPTGEAFRLGRLRVRHDLKGAAFSELPEDEQEAILNYSLRVVLIPKQADPELKYEIFERLNSGSQVLSDMELRNCIYRGPYNDLLRLLSCNMQLLAIRGAKAPDPKMRDRQWILRFFAMRRQMHTLYRGPMKTFLNEEMRAHRFAPPEEIERLRTLFESAIECAYLVFGSHAFRRYEPGSLKDPNGSWSTSGPVNVALWDTILYSLSFYQKRQIVEKADAIREEFLDMLTHDPVFLDYIGRTTDKPDRVQYRADTWMRRLRGIIHVPANEARLFSRELKKKLYERNDACAICGQVIMDLNDAEVDHVHHYWRGGATVPENARLTHRFCNRQRGGR